MGVKSSKQSYNVEKVGQNVKSRDSLRKKELEEKHLPVSNDMVIEEIISAVQKTEQVPTPRLSKEEQLKEEELIIAKVRGEIIPSLEDSPKYDVKEDVKPNNANDLDAITVIKEEISESVPIVTLQNIVEAEKARTLEAKRVSIKENHEEINNDLSNEIEKFESSKIEEINTIVCTNEIINQSDKAEIPPDVTKTEELVEETSTIEVEQQEKSLQVERVENKIEEITETIIYDNIDEKICIEATKENQESSNLLVVGVNEKESDYYESKSNGFLETKQNPISADIPEEETLKIVEQIEIRNELNCTTTTVDRSDEIKETTCKTLENQNGTFQTEKLEISIGNPPKEEKIEATPKQLVLQQISDVEKIVNGLKEKILHFSGTAQDKEFSVLHEELIKHIIKLDDISFEDDEVMNERRRVIKMIQRCVQNLERKLEQSDDDHHTSDSE